MYVGIGEMSESEQQNAEAIEGSVSESLREELKREEPTEAGKRKLREQHDGHLVRDTSSKLAIDSPDIAPGVEVDAKAEIPDTYCFTCGAWIGLSGVDLRGTPRSRSEAYYIGGMPADVLNAKNGTAKTLNELADALIDRVNTINDRDEAYRFIGTELEKMERQE